METFLLYHKFPQLLIRKDINKLESLKIGQRVFKKTRKNVQS